MRGLARALIALGGVCLVVALLLVSVFFVAYDRAFYARTYASLGVAQTVGMSEADLMRATDALIEYCRGERADLAVVAAIDGERRAVFNEREIDHMVDVRGLAQTATRARDGLLAACALLLVMGMALARRHGVGVVWPLLAGMMLGVLALGALGFYAATDFGAFWTKFHLLLFTNDLWLLDPFESVLINMVPEAFFYAMVMRVLSAFGAAVVLIPLLGAAVLRLVRRARAKRGKA
jgi:integral membrane protein (TIGR01906 family)